MRFPHKFAILLFALLLATWSLAQQPEPAQQAPLLPKIFAGWEQTSAQTGTDPAVVDQASSQVLKEYGFTDFETATYTQDGRKLTVKAARFRDASGAYGAFTFYRTPVMKTETIGTMAASDNDRVFFFRGNVLVMADFDHITAMSAAELRELASDLPSKGGEASNLPTLPNFYPRTELQQNSAKYVLGPEALSALNAPLPASLVDFQDQPEILLGKYTQNNGNADFMLISYPTPQIAAARLRAIDAANPQQQGTTFLAKRSGPLVALIKGQISAGDAKSLLAHVNYEADVTWNENTGLSKRDNIGNLVIAASVLAGIIFLISVGTGALFGFGRVLLQKVFPDKFQAHSDEAAFIKLNLRD
jgi:Family of unknown function (DUF6599)